MTYKEFFIDELGDGGYVVCYEMADIERKLGFGPDSLVNCLLIFKILKNHNACCDDLSLFSVV
jgi:hypothetical protein